ncbi:MAG: ABC transporter permease [Bacteroidetes bacterium]|nr:MAG: ABC transporter permease [Bacteroidota bacterium]
MRFFLILYQSLDAIRANLFRAGVTIFIIALGITALAGVLTSIDGIKSGISSSFSSLGSNTFRIRNFVSEVRIGGRHRRDKPKRYPPIEYRQAVAFKEVFGNQAIVSITGNGGGINEVKYRSVSTNPNITVIGTDENYLKTARFELAEGRNITAEDNTLARNVVIIGNEIKEKLFEQEPAVGKVVNISGKIYRVIGTFAKMGTTGGRGLDNMAVVPLNTLRNHRSNMGSLTLNVYVDDPTKIDYYMDEARGNFRLVRNLKPRDPDDFSVMKSDAFVEDLMENLKVLTISAQVIALITLLGASIALLNVMLVSVTERTNEIGLRKALGATRKNILHQFLTEAVVICQLGGILGIVMGLLVGNLLGTILLQGEFVVPWLWIGIGLFACFIVGVASGYYPAWKAARVDPIESLRRE